jgi:hypothetical protein
MTRAKKTLKSPKTMKTQPPLTLAIKPVPKSLHGVNLRKLLTQTQWRKLRQSVIDRDGSSCLTCNSIPDRIYAHEDWEYDTTQKPAVARIGRIALQCWHCHACEHFMHTLIMVEDGSYGGQVIDEIVAHFCKVNGVGPEVFEAHLNGAIADWERLSELDWKVDFRPFAEADVLIAAEPKPPAKRKKKAGPLK